MLQIIDIGWSDGHRAFVKTGEEFHEVAAGMPVDSASLFRVTEKVFRLQARLIDVDDGEIVMSIDVSQGTSRVAARSQTIQHQGSPLQGVTRDLDADGPERRQEATKQVMALFFASLRQDARPSSGN